MQMKPNAKDKTLIIKFAVHFEVMKVVSCNKIDFYKKIKNFYEKFYLLTYNNSIFLQLHSIYIVICIE